MSRAPATAENPTPRPGRKAWLYARERVVRTFTLLCASVAILTTFGILWVLISQSVPFFRAVPFRDFAFGTDWKPNISPASFGVLPLVAGTLMITVGAGLLALPIGLLSAVYLREYADPRLRNILKPALELLAGVPTVVYGYFAVFTVTPLLRQWFPAIQTYNALSGAIVVGIMILPLVSSLCEDALAAVPRSLREGAYGLGSTKLEVTTRIVIPAGLSGIAASFILALSRALGETMAVALAAGSTPVLTLDPTRSIQTMTAYIVEVTSGDAAQGGARYNSIFAVGLTLFAFTLAMNLLAGKLVRRYRQVVA